MFYRMGMSSGAGLISMWCSGLAFVLAFELVLTLGVYYIIYYTIIYYTIIIYIILLYIISYTILFYCYTILFFSSLLPFPLLPLQSSSDLSSSQSSLPLHSIKGIHLSMFKGYTSIKG